MGTYTRGVPPSGRRVALPELSMAGIGALRTKRVTPSSAECRRALEASVKTSAREVGGNSGAPAKSSKSAGGGDGDPKERYRIAARQSPPRCCSRAQSTCPKFSTQTRSCGSDDNGGSSGGGGERGEGTGGDGSGGTEGVALTNGGGEGSGGSEDGLELSARGAEERARGEPRRRRAWRGTMVARGWRPKYTGLSAGAPDDAAVPALVREETSGPRGK